MEVKVSVKRARTTLKRLLSKDQWYGMQSTRWKGRAEGIKNAQPLRRELDIHIIGMFDAEYSNVKIVYFRT